MVNSRAIAAGIPVLQGGEDVNIGNDFSRAIAKMMDQGLDVKRPLAEGALPLLEYAEQQGAKNVVVTMRAHLARTAAHSLLDEMDNEPTKAAPR